MGTSRKKVSKVTKATKVAKVAKVSKVAKATTKKKASVSKKAVSKKKEEFLTLHLHHDEPELDPIVPRLPDMPEPPEPAEMGICKHCHLLPAAAFELVIVMTCLIFSLSAVLLTSTQTIERQQDVIATLQKVKLEVYVRR